MTRENWRSTTGRVWPEHVSGMARGVDAMDIIARDGIVGRMCDVVSMHLQI